MAVSLVKKSHNNPTQGWVKYKILVAGVKFEWAPKGESGGWWTWNELTETWFNAEVYLIPSDLRRLREAVLLGLEVMSR